MCCGLRKSHSPTSCSEEGQCWVQTRLLRALSNQIWKTSKTGDSPASLCSLFQCFASPPVKRLFLVSGWNLPCFTVLDSGVPAISGAISLCLPPGKVPLMGVAAGACSSVHGPHCCVFSKELQRPSSNSWESCLLFCQLRSRNPQLLYLC